MLDRLYQYILDNSPTIALMIAVIVITVYVTIRIYKHIHKLNVTSDKVEALPCDIHTKTFQSIQQTLQTLNSVVEKRSEDTAELCAWVMKHDNEMIDRLTKKASPLTFTPLGKLLFETIPTKRLIDENCNFLIGEIEKEEPQTPFDVENIALRILMRNIGHSMFNDLKNYLYYSSDKMTIQNPESGENEEVEINMSVALQLMAIYLRDLYMDANPSVIPQKSRNLA